MTGKARVFIFLSPSSVSSCAQVFAVTVSLLPNPHPRLFLLHLLLLHASCLTLSAAHSQVTQVQEQYFFFHVKPCISSKSPQFLFLDIRPLSGQECCVAPDVCSEGYFPVEPP